MCGVNRYQEVGVCRANASMMINAYHLHFGEEPNLSGKNGSGTIFFSHCNTNCVYCQNFSISQFGWGTETSNEELADIMLGLQDAGANNINLVTPTHYTPQIIQSIKLAKAKGLTIPIVWNSNAYENVETLKELEGLVDIYLPDFRYFDNTIAEKYSNAKNYTEYATKAISEMYRQVGHIKEKNDIAYRGLMIRILVLPNNINQVDKILDWIYDNIGRETYINLMEQYYPTYRAAAYPEINRPITKEEYYETVNKLISLGFDNGFVQGKKGNIKWTPKQDK
jgi:putative pyruvate formate lyase activating enzyme